MRCKLVTGEGRGGMRSGVGDTPFKGMVGGPADLKKQTFLNAGVTGQGEASFFLGNLSSVGDIGQNRMWEGGARGGGDYWDSKIEYFCLSFRIRARPIYFCIPLK